LEFVFFKRNLVILLIQLLYNQMKKFKEAFLRNSLVVCILMAFLIVACQQKKTFIPKPTAYPKINLPKASYSTIVEKHPFIFEMSKQAVMVPDTFGAAEPHWVILKYPALDAIIQLTYKPVNRDLKRLQGIINDAYKLTSKHQIKAYAIDEQIYTSPTGTRATMLTIKGEVPSQFQFFTTDTTNNYLRGAIYFRTALKNDSLAPVIEYLKADCVHLINTLKWRK
jgi:gliding motility-associated lipoprotein GldD